MLSENDLLEFLVMVIQNAPPLPAFIKARFSDPNASFLLGFGFHQWDVRILLPSHSHQDMEPVESYCSNQGDWSRRGRG